MKSQIYDIYYHKYTASSRVQASLSVGGSCHHFLSKTLNVGHTVNLQRR